MEPQTPNHMGEIVDGILGDPAKIGVISILVAIVSALVTGRFVVTVVHHNQVVSDLKEQLVQSKLREDRALSERDEYKEMVITSVRAMDAAVRVAEKK